MNITRKKLCVDNKLFLLVFVITFTVFIFTTDGHRYTFDEDMAEQQSKRIATMQPDPNYVQDQSRIFFEYPDLYPPIHNGRAICNNAILCSQAYIGHSITQAPFIFINHNFHIITDDIKLTIEDFDDPHYVWWRNTLDPDFTFLELFYGPVFSALSVGVFFLVCRTFDFSRQNSITLAFFYGFSTIIWAYSKTSLNSVPMVFFVLLGIFFYRRFQKNQTLVDSLLCAASFGFAFLIRPDTVLFIIPLFFFMLYELRKKNKKIKKFFAFIIPTISAYGIFRIINFIRVEIPQEVANGVQDAPNVYPFHIGIFGLFLSPGAGILIFAPILFTIFFSFPDFYKRNRLECLLFLSFIVSFVISFGGAPTWHGLNGWSARYMLPIIPFLLLPLGASIEKRKNRILKIFLVILGGFGLFFNLAYMVQDVNWFVWGTFGQDSRGLYSLARNESGGVESLWINPLVIWTFQYSQLTQSIILAFVHLQPDIFLLKVLGPTIFILIFIVIIVPSTYLLFRLLENKLSIQKHS